MKRVAIFVLISYWNFGSQASGQDGVITTVAGNGTTAFCGVGSCSGDGGPAASTSMSSGGIAMDASGSLIIGDCLNNRVRKVSPSRLVTTIAGTGNPTGPLGDGGPAASASFYCPQGIAVDASGNIFVADSFNNRVRKVSPSGIVTTVAGNSSRGGNSGGFSGDGGPATAASLYLPEGVAVDSSGNLFIADSRNFRIRKVSPSGIIATVAGGGGLYNPDGGPATSASIYADGVAVDASGNFFIAGGINRVWKVSPNGIITTVAGDGTAGFSGDGGPAIAAELNGGPQSPFGIAIGVAVDALGNLFIVDAANNRIRKVFSNGVITTVVGNGAKGFSGDGGLATEAQLYLAFGGGVAVDAVGNLFIADYSNNRIRKVSAQAAGAVISVVSTQINFSQLQGQLGTSVQSIQFGGTTGAAWYAMATTSTGGAWLSISPGSGQIGESLTAVVSSAILQPGTYQGSIVVQAPGAAPSSITITVTLTITCSATSTKSGITTVAGNGTNGFSGDGGPATSASLYFLGAADAAGLAVACGNVFIADFDNNRVRKVTPGGIIITVAGGGRATPSDGLQATSVAIGVEGVAVDAPGNLFIADGGHSIWEVSPAGVIKRAAGNGTSGFSGDGGPPPPPRHWAEPRV